MELLGIFAKYWQPGAVKTRLAVAIGDEAACTLYRRFILVLLRRLHAVADRRTVYCTPAERVAAFAALAGEAWQVAPQADGDLGRRMEDFFARSFAAGASRAVLLGSDSPLVPIDFVQRAFRLLREVPVVLGPASDGGYYLIGAAERVPPVFTDIAWSTSDVWSQTVQRLEQADCPFATLPEWYDVDDLDSLRRLGRDLAATPANEDDLDDLREHAARALAVAGAGQAVCS